MTKYECHRCSVTKTCILEIKDGLNKVMCIPRPAHITRPSCPAVTGLGDLVHLIRGHYPVRCHR